MAGRDTLIQRRDQSTSAAINDLHRMQQTTDAKQARELRDKVFESVDKAVTSIEQIEQGDRS